MSIEDFPDVKLKALAVFPAIKLLVLIASDPPGPQDTAVRIRPLGSTFIARGEDA
jgi:hypothetical protein